MLFADDWWVASLVSLSDRSAEADGSGRSVRSRARAGAGTRELPLSICAILIKAALSPEPEGSRREAGPTVRTEEKARNAL